MAYRFYIGNTKKEATASRPELLGDWEIYCEVVEGQLEVIKLLPLLYGLAKMGERGLSSNTEFRVSGYPLLKKECEYYQQVVKNKIANEFIEKFIKLTEKAQVEKKPIFGFSSD